MDCASFSNLVSDDESFGCCLHCVMVLNTFNQRAAYCRLQHDDVAAFTIEKDNLQALLSICQEYFAS